MKNKVICLISTLCLILCAFLSCVDYWCFSNSFYKNEYTKLDTANEISMSQDDLDKTTDVLLGYLKDKYSSLDTQAKVEGISREVFNDREKAHMVDVKNLYQNVLVVRNVCFIVYLLSFIYICFSSNTKYIFSSYKKSLAIFGFIIGFILLFCLIDFDGFWTNFHHVFFPNNDLWLLDPRTDILIMMVPSQFFFDLCISIIVSIIVFLLGIYFIFKYLDRKLAND